MGVDVWLVLEGPGLISAFMMLGLKASFLCLGVLFFPRLALCPGKANRPSILITKSFDIYLGNLNSEAMDVPCGELFGFNVGSFEMRIVKSFWAIQFETRFLHILQMKDVGQHA